MDGGNANIAGANICSYVLYIMHALLPAIHDSAENHRNSYSIAVHLVKHTNTIPAPILINLANQLNKRFPGTGRL